MGRVLVSEGDLTPEREVVLKWLLKEMAQYSNKKFGNGVPRDPDEHDLNMEKYGFTDEHDDAFWFRQVTQYFSRAKIFGLKGDAGPRGRQAMMKGLMTLFDCCASMVRMFGPPPRPGVPSGTVEAWEPIPKQPDEPMCRYGHHPGRSCLLPDDYHMVFSRILTEEEWTAVAGRIDTTWDSEHNTWDPEKVTSLIAEIAPDVECSFYEPRIKPNA